MKYTLPRIFLSCLFSFIGMTAFAYDCEVDGLYYNLDKTSKTASFTCRTTYGAYYKGDIKIPASFTHEGVTYSVTSISDYAFYLCKDLTSVSIPNSVVSIGYRAFSECNSLTSLIIPNGTTSIAREAFWKCNGLIEMNIPNSVTTIGDYAFAFCENLASLTLPSCDVYIDKFAFKGCTGMTSLVIPEGVTTIEEGVFYDCSSLTSVTIPSSITSIGHGGFSHCGSLTSVTFADNTNIDSIGGNAFAFCYKLKKVIVPDFDIKAWCSIDFGDEFANPLYYAKNLYSNEDTPITQLEIPNDVTSIGQYAFCYYNNLTSVTFPKSVTSVGKGAFQYCYNIKKLIVPDFDIATWCAVEFKNSSSNPLRYAGHLYSNENDEITEAIIPNGVTSVGDYAFYNCQGLTSVTIPRSITSIGDEAFSLCSNLEKVIAPEFDAAAWCAIKFSNFGSNPLDNAKHLYRDENTEITSIDIPNTVTSIGNYAFQNCQGLTSVTIANGVESIGNWAFIYTGLTSIGIPASVNNIGDRAFRGCDKCSLVICGRNTPPTAYDSTFPDGLKAIVPANVNAYETAAGWRNMQFVASFALKGTTQATATLNSLIDLSDMYATVGENKYYADGSSITITKLAPNTSYTINAYGKYGDIELNGIFNVHTKEIPITVRAESITASSCILTGGWGQMDAVVSGRGFIDHPDEIAVQLAGLDPNTTYTKTFYVETEGGGRQTKNITFTTKPLSFITQQPKIVSLGNAIIAANSNLYENETNIGFEWRRTDWTDDFASNTGTAYLYNGTMEGYIRNLNTDKLWKYRPYYLSNSGTYYYGDWVGLDPTNTSYFEPTVHTYDKIEVEGNTALVKGYALTGTDGVVVQGFKYWKITEGTRNASGINLVASVPSNAMTVTASGQVMTANLTELDYNSTYHYTAFVTTSTGETFYGEELAFSTDENPTGIYGVATEKAETNNATKQGVYTLTGVKVGDDISDLHSLPRGVYIVNGKKYFVK